MGSSFSWQGGSAAFNTTHSWKDNSYPLLTGTVTPTSADTADFGPAATSGATITGGGTIQALTVEAKLTFAATIGAATIGNSGTLTVISGSLSATNSFVNSGVAIIAGGAISASSLTDTGSIQVQGGSLNDTGYLADNGTVAVAGSGWINDSAVVAVGSAGNGVLTISAGGVVSDSTGIEGNLLGSRGSVTVNGAAAVWWNSGQLTIGQNGSGVLAVQNGAASDAQNLLAAATAGSSATIAVSGTKSEIGVADSAIIGEAGTVTVTVQNAALFYLGALATIGSQSGAVAAVTVTGSGSQMEAGQAVVVGDAGAGSLAVQSAGLVSTENVIVGNQAGGSGSGVVSGPGSSLEAWQSVYVGEAGKGSLEVLGGATAISDLSCNIGSASGASGTVLVSGAGSLLNAEGALVIGNAGAGTLSIENGGSATTAVLELGNLIGGSGTLAETGAGSSVTASTAAIGGNWNSAGGRGLLDIAAGALLTDSGWTNVWTPGTIDLAGGSMVTQAVNLSGTIVGNGTIDAVSAAAGYQVMNGGSIVSSLGTLDLIGGVTGNGTLAISAGSELLVQNTVAASQTVAFLPGVGEVLALGAPSQMLAAITGFGTASTIELLGVTVTRLIYRNGVFTAIGPGGPDGTLRAVGTFAMTGSMTSSMFSFSVDAAGNSSITLPAAPAAPPSSPSEPDISGYLETNRFFAGSSPWNTTIVATTASSAIPGIGSRVAGLTSWSPTSGSVAIYYAQDTDPLVEVIYNPNTYAEVTSGAWLRSGNSAAVEQQILASSSAVNPIPGNPYSTDVAGLVWNSTPSGLPASYNRWTQGAGQALYINVPAGALPPGSSDGQTAIIEQDGTAIELDSPIVLSTGQWVSSMYSATNALTGNGTGTDNGRTASMIENYAGVLRDTDITAGTIDHALAIVVPESMMKAAVAGPALAFDANSSGYIGTLPMGSHLALPSSLNLSTLNFSTSVGTEIAVAAQAYGEFVVDTGGSGISVVVQNDPTSAALNTYSAQLQSDLNTIFHHEILLAN